MITELSERPSYPFASPTSGQKAMVRGARPRGDADAGGASGNTQPNDTGGAAPLFQPIRPPTLRRPTTKNCIIFLRQRQEYETRVAQANKDNATNIQMMDVKSCVETSLQESLVFYQKIVKADGTHVKHKDELTDELLLQYIRSTAQKPATIHAAGISHAIAKVRMASAAEEPDAEGRVLQLGHDYLKALNDSGYSAYLDDEENVEACLLYTSPSPRDGLLSRMPSSA